MPVVLLSLSGSMAVVAGGFRMGMLALEELRTL